MAQIANSCRGTFGSTYLTYVPASKLSSIIFPWKVVACIQKLQIKSTKGLIFCQDLFVALSSLNYLLIHMLFRSFVFFYSWLVDPSRSVIGWKIVPAFMITTKYTVYTRFGHVLKPFIIELKPLKTLINCENKSFCLD